MFGLGERRLARPLLLVGSMLALIGFVSTPSAFAAGPAAKISVCVETQGSPTAGCSTSDPTLDQGGVTFVATVTDSNGNPVGGVPVTFVVTSGPNQGTATTTDDTATSTTANSQQPLGTALFSYDSISNSGTDTVTASFTDRNGVTHSATAEVTWQTDPAVTQCTEDCVTSVTTTEGTAFNGTVANFNDSGTYAPDNDYTATIDWGDGSTPTQGVVTGTFPNFNVVPSITFTGNTTNNSPVVKDVSSTVTGELQSGMPISGNGIPSGTTVDSIDSPTQITLSNNATATKTGDSLTAGTPHTYTEDSYSQPAVTNCSSAHQYCISVTLTDNDNSNVSEPTLYTPATVNDVAIVAKPITIQPVEGNSYDSAIGYFVDPNPYAESEYSATIAWGDGATSPTDGQSVTVSDDGPCSNSGNSGLCGGSTGELFEVDGTHTYADEGTDSITITVTDENNPITEPAIDSTADVQDAALTGGGVSQQFQQVSTAFNNGMLASFNDGNPTSTPADFEPTTQMGNGGSISINWGDGTTDTNNSNVSLTQPDGTGTTYDVSGKHTYTKTGKYTVTVTVDDDGGSTFSATDTIIVYAVTSGGNFVIGDKVTGPSVEFWGSDWYEHNHLSESSNANGQGPPGFWGFSNNPQGAPSCDTNWTAIPYTSATHAGTPKAPLPSYIEVIVASQVTATGTGSSVSYSGNTVKLDVIKVSSYSQTGTGRGTLVGTIQECNGDNGGDG